MTTKPTSGTDTQIALGKLFREAREHSGVTLRQLAERMGMSINTIRWHEAGTRCIRVDDLVMAARMMGVPPDILIRDAMPVDEAIERLAASIGITTDELTEKIARPLPRRRRKKPVGAANG